MTSPSAAYSQSTHHGILENAWNRDAVDLDWLRFLREVVVHRMTDCTLASFSSRDDLAVSHALVGSLSNPICHTQHPLARSCRWPPPCAATSKLSYRPNLPQFEGCESYMQHCTRRCRSTWSSATLHGGLHANAVYNVHKPIKLRKAELLLRTTP